MPRKDRRRGDRHEELLSQITSAAPESTPFADRRVLRRFIGEYYRNLSLDDVSAFSVEDLAFAAIAHAKQGRTRKPGEHKLRVYNPTLKRDGWESSNTIVELVHDNMPFLVDSLSMTLDRTGYAIRLTVHPLIRCVRTSGGRLKDVKPRKSKQGTVDSFIRLEIRKESRADRLRTLAEEIEKTLTDVRAAVKDWQPMQDRMQSVIAQLEAQQHADPDRKRESLELLRWLAAERFTFLGYRQYRLNKKKGELELTPIRGSALGLNTVGNRRGSAHVLSPAMQRYRRSSELLLITKANSRSTVHRPSYLDYLGVKAFNEKGEAVGEHRFIGLFTSQAYSAPVGQIPLVREKITEILDRAGLDPTGHRGKALIHILNNYPRDELFQASVADLARTTTGVLNLQERRRVKLFMRRDTFRRFYSCLVFIPREKYNTEVRERTETILRDALQGETVESHVQLSDSALARVHLLVYADSRAANKVSLRQIEQRIAEAVVTWRDRLREALIRHFGEEVGVEKFEQYGRVFPLAYEEDASIEQAVDDLAFIERQLQPDATSADSYQLQVRADGSLRFVALRLEHQLALSDALPLLENLGMRVLTERPYQLRLADRRAWLQDFELQPATQTSNKQLRRATENLIQGFHGQLTGSVERDRYNLLITLAGLNASRLNVLRAYATYLLQIGLPFRQRYLEEIFAEYAAVVGLALDYFDARFNPDKRRTARTVRELERKVRAGIADAVSLDADRALRALFSAMRATQRTNVFTGALNLREQAFAFKIDTAHVDEAPLPRPAHEIFVYSPRVEGVHLRAGSVARGGLRWSDRRDDFRTEVLGLMKAQTVKNTVIVPTGAKGGFYPKQLPDGDRNAILEEAIACYSIFIRALLSVTDNLVGGKTVTPDRVVRYDDPDPYLVVAADKGTATFSDIANSIATEQGFWLGDAFASGGSAGYDHKKMAITARGAWEAVKRHFREMGTDTQTDAFTVAAIGDMSGDVFGNGMLLSPTLRLQAAFNHRHIFLDPTPDPTSSFEERKRLFELPRSGWDDYNTDLLSDGGGVFDRSQKSIALSDPIRKLLDLRETEASPLDIIKAILRMRVDLLWNGGIGTYVKASDETHADAGDRQNDSVRVDATELRCKVIGEGGNLGLTQLGRVEFAQLGGRINTDFIDNSAGVDSSDREVNIKILLARVAESRNLPASRRNKLLARMTDEVAALVLRNNYLQTQAISMMEARAVQRLSEHRSIIQALQKRGLLNRRLEGLPDDETLDARARDQQGFTRPELSVLLSYAKLDLYGQLSKCELHLGSHENEELTQYFPTPLRASDDALMPQHRLASEIVRTLLTNSLVNRMGPAFAIRAQEETGSSIDRVAQSYVIARDMSNARQLWADIERLDTRIPTNIQYSMMYEIARKLRHACYWILRNCGTAIDVDEQIRSMSGPVQTILQSLPDLMGKAERSNLSKSIKQHLRMGVPERLAGKVSALSYITDALESVRIATDTGCSIDGMARTYFAVGHRLSIDWVRGAIDRLPVEGIWQARARGTLRDRAMGTQRALAGQVFLVNKCRDAETGIRKLVDMSPERFERVEDLLSQMRESGSEDFASLTVAVNEITTLVSESLEA
ncbi:MAG: NAD-glutamate dehydrogenase [Pseudomonadota bacterium]